MALQRRFDLRVPCAPTSRSPANKSVVSRNRSSTPRITRMSRNAFPPGGPTPKTRSAPRLRVFFSAVANGGYSMSLGTILLIILVIILLGGFSGFGGGPFYGTGYYGGGGLGLVIVILLILVLMGRI